MPGNWQGPVGGGAACWCWEPSLQERRNILSAICSPAFHAACECQFADVRGACGWELQCSVHSRESAVPCNKACDRAGNSSHEYSQEVRER